MSVPAFADATAIAAAVSGGTASARDIVAAALDRIARLDGQVGAFTDVLGERALARADALDAAGAAASPQARSPACRSR